MASGGLRRKLTLTLAGRKIVLIKKAQESLEHVLGKAGIMALYGEEYPDMQVEVPARDRYKPDLLVTDEAGEPLFWAEVGQVKKKKVEQLLKRYPATHFVFARHGLDPVAFERLVRKAAAGARHEGGRIVDVLGLPPEKEIFIEEDGSFSLPEGSYSLTRILPNRE
jgi:hypothetical protein